MSFYCDANDTGGQQLVLEEVLRLTGGGSGAAQAYNSAYVNGRLGIGTSTPSSLLHIHGDMADGKQGILITRDDTSTADTNLLGAIGFDSSDGNIPSKATEASAGIAAYAAEDHGTGDKGGDLVFFTSPIDQNDDTDALERMRIDSQGNVGIGTTSPAAQLHVGSTAYELSSGAYLTGSHQRTAKMVIHADYANTDWDEQEIGLALHNEDPTNNNWSPHIAFTTHEDDDGNPANANPVAVAAISATYNTRVANGWAKGDLVFFTNNAGSGNAERLRITGAGNVGIGTATPSTALQVSGTVTATAFAGALTGNVTGNVSGSAATATTATNANQVNATNDRDLAPEDLNYANDFQVFFTSKEGLEDGSTNGSNYMDAIVLNTWSDASGHDANVLAFDKSTKAIYHYQADQAATNWGTPKQLAYTDQITSDVTISANNDTDETVYLTFVDGATGTQGLETDTGLSYNPNSGRLTANVFVGDATGTATALATARAINGVNFDGTADITITAAGSTLSDTVTVAKGGTGATSLTSNAILTGNGTSAIQAESTFTYDGAGIAVITGALPQLQLVDSDATNDPMARIMNNNGNLSIRADSSNVGTGGAINFQTSGSEKMRIQDDGKVGIGTTSPQANLHISGGTGGDGVLIIEADTDNNAEADQPYIVFEQDGGTQHSAIGSHSGGNTDNNALIFSNSVSSSGVEAGMIFKTGETSGYANATERMRITPAGNIGIGTASPSAPLHIYTTSTSEPSLLIENDEAQAPADAIIRLQSSGGSNSWIDFIQNTYGQLDITGGGSTRRQILTVDDPDTDAACTISFNKEHYDWNTQIFGDSSTPAIFVEGGNSNVGIGTTSPNAKLHVSGDTYIQSATANQLLRVHADTDSSPSPRIEMMRGAHDTWGTGDNYTDWRIENSNDLIFYSGFSSQSSGAAVERLRIHSDSDGLSINGTLVGLGQFVIFGEEGDLYSGTGSTGNANGYQLSYGNGRANVTNASNGTDFGINVPHNCVLERVDVVFGNSGNVSSGTTTFVVVKNGSNQSGNLSTTHSSGVHDSHHTGLSHTFSAGDRFNLRTTTSSRQVGPMRMTATFKRTA